MRCASLLETVTEKSASCNAPLRITAIVVRDQGHGFDPNAALNPLAVENLLAENGRGIYLMKFAGDEVSFERGGTEVHIRRKSGIEQVTSVQPIQKRMARRFVRRPWPGVRTVEFG
jgi:anti-sigma regulatory factor (Ser/Thr protein kinase)